MRHLITVVIPKIQAYWVEVAYLLRFKIPDVDAIRMKYNGDPAKCCLQLLQDWLSTNKDSRAKTWPTLLASLKELDSLTASVEEIKSTSITP